MIAARHPRPIGADGLCLGRTELPVDPRRAKRLAHRLRAVARQDGLPHDVVTSPRERCGAVARWLRRWGWRVGIDQRLAELDFGRWDGRAWSDIPKPHVDAWTDDFVNHAPGDGESLASLLERVRAVLADPPAAVLITHGGWLSAARWLMDNGNQLPVPVTWPAAPRHAAIVTLRQIDSGSGPAGAARRATNCLNSPQGSGLATT